MLTSALYRSRCLSFALVTLAALFPLSGSSQIAKELTLEIVATRIDAVRSAAAEGDEDLAQAYENVQALLDQANGHEREAEDYLDAMIRSPERETEVRARIDSLEAAEVDTAETARLSREELEVASESARTELADVERTLDAVEERLAARETNAEMARQRLAEIGRRLIELGDVQATVSPDASPSTGEALRWSAKAEQIALVAERRALEARLASQPARYAVLQAESAELALRIEKLDERARNLDAMARTRLLAVATPETLGIAPGRPAYALAGRLVTENSHLRDHRLDFEGRLDRATALQAETQQLSDDLEDRFRTARRVVEFASESDVLGEVLLAYWEEIETLRLPEPSDSISREVGDTVISRIGFEKEGNRLISASRFVSEELETAGLDPDVLFDSERDALVDLARSRRELLRRMIAVQSAYIGVLGELEATHGRQRALVDDYTAYIGGLILWIPSRHALWRSDPSDIPGELRRLRAALQQLHVTVHPWLVLGLLVAGALIFLRRGLREFQHAQNARTLKARSDSVGFTFLALLLTLVRAAPQPLALLSVGGLFSNDASLAGTALFDTVHGLALVLFALRFLRILCEPHGVAREHFGWLPEACDRVCEEVGWVVRWWLLPAAAASFLFMMNDETILMGRIGLLFAVLLLGSYLTGCVRRDWRIQGASCLSANPTRIRLLLIVFLVVLTSGIVWGLRYSVTVVTSRLLATLLIALALLVLHEFLTRWLSVVRRRLRLAERLASREKLEAGESEVDGDEQLDLVTIGSETARLLSLATVVAGLVALVYVWAPLLPAFDALAGVTLWTSVSVTDSGDPVTTKITLETLIVVVALLAVTFYATRKLPALVELILRSRTRLTAGERYTASTLLRYAIVATGVVAALAALGLKWSQLQWLVAALGVGIGFGLQEIVANFISGLIILFERPIRVGDVVTVGDKDGTVTKIRIRATTICDFDGKELLVPNKEFITGRLLNWTLSDSNVRLVIPVGIAYGSDVSKALEILHAITADDPKILGDPEPSIIFSDFGDSVVELTARFFVSSFDDYWPTTNAVRQQIYERFAAAGIDISFPQRDVHLDTQGPIRVALEPSGSS